jgi:hypothetical protein
MARFTEFHRQQKAWVSDERKGEERREAGRSTSPTTSFERGVLLRLRAERKRKRGKVGCRMRGGDRNGSWRVDFRLELLIF